MSIRVITPSGVIESTAEGRALQLEVGCTCPTYCFGTGPCAYGRGEAPQQKQLRTAGEYDKLLADAESCFIGEAWHLMERSQWPEHIKLADELAQAKLYSMAAWQAVKDAERDGESVERLIRESNKAYRNYVESRVKFVATVKRPTRELKLIKGGRS